VWLFADAARYRSHAKRHVRAGTPARSTRADGLYSPLPVPTGRDLHPFNAIVIELPLVCRPGSTRGCGSSTSRARAATATSWADELAGSPGCSTRLRVPAGCPRRCPDPESSREFYDQDPGTNYAQARYSRLLPAKSTACSCPSTSASARARRRIRLVTVRCAPCSAIPTWPRSSASGKTTCSACGFRDAPTVGRAHRLTPPRAGPWCDGNSVRRVGSTCDNELARAPSRRSA